jgi:hypothetical protein
MAAAVLNGGRSPAYQISQLIRDTINMKRITMSMISNTVVRLSKGGKSSTKNVEVTCESDGTYVAKVVTITGTQVVPLGVHRGLSADQLMEVIR